MGLHPNPIRTLTTNQSTYKLHLLNWDFVRSAERWLLRIKLLTLTVWQIPTPLAHADNVGAEPRSLQEPADLSDQLCS